MFVSKDVARYILFIELYPHMYFKSFEFLKVSNDSRTKVQLSPDLENVCHRHIFVRNRLSLSQRYYLDLKSYRRSPNLKNYNPHQIINQIRNQRRLFLLRNFSDNEKIYFPQYYEYSVTTD